MLIVFPIVIKNLYDLLNKFLMYIKNWNARIVRVNTSTFDLQGKIVGNIKKVSFV